MKRHMAWLILVPSLLFNVFFAAGYFQARAQMDLSDSETRQTRLVVEALGLDEAQTRRFAELRSGVDADVKLYNDGMLLAQRELAEVLRSDEPDLDRARSIVARQADLHRQQELTRSASFNSFLGVLRPEQCRRLSRRMPHRRGLLKRFDANGDGTLDDSELALAQQKHEEHRARRHQEVLERFDVDGDGALDDQERAAMLEARSERHQRKRQELLDQFDVDGDGTINDDEREAAEVSRRERMLERFDADGDGLLSPDERHEMMEWRRENRGGPRR